MRARAPLAAVLCAASALPAAAGGAGGESFNFLLLDADARAVAMGGAYTALATDANALLYNPAGLGFLQEHDASFMANRYAQGVTQEYLAFAARQGWGVNLIHLSFGELERTTVAKPEPAGSFGITDLGLGVGYGRKLAPAVGVGAGLKFLHESIDNVAASGFALDLGTLYMVPGVRGLALGGAIRNIGPPVRFQSEASDLPLDVRLGGAYRYLIFDRPAAAALDLSKGRRSDPVIGVGFEWTAAEGRLPLRLGFNTRNDAGTGVTVGFGWVHEQRFRFQYAFVPLGELGAAHRVSIGLRWGDPREKEVPELILPSAAESPGEEAAPARPEAREMYGLRRPTAESHFAKAEEAIAKGAFLDARRALQDASVLLAENDGRWVYYFERLGYVYYSERVRANAILAYEQAFRQAARLSMSGRHLADAYAGIAYCHIDEGRPAEAAQYLRKALEAGPAEAPATLIRAKLAEIEKGGGHPPAGAMGPVKPLAQ